MPAGALRPAPIAVTRFHGLSSRKRVDEMRRALMGARAISYRPIGAVATTLLATTVVAGACLIGMCASAQARLIRINADPPSVIDLPAFGPSGPYLKISGTFDGELDPADQHNAPIADIELAPRRSGKVQYTSTFYILRPLDLAKGNRRLFYDFGNRGNKRILQWFNDGKESDDPPRQRISATAS